MSKNKHTFTRMQLLYHSLLWGAKSIYATAVKRYYQAEQQVQSEGIRYIPILLWQALKPLLKGLYASAKKGLIVLIQGLSNNGTPANVLAAQNASAAGHTSAAPVQSVFTWGFRILIKAISTLLASLLSTLVSIGLLVLIIGLVIGMKWNGFISVPTLVQWGSLLEKEKQGTLQCPATGTDAQHGALSDTLKALNEQKKGHGHQMRTTQNTTACQKQQEQRALWTTMANDGRLQQHVHYIHTHSLWQFTQALINSPSLAHTVSASAAPKPPQRHERTAVMQRAHTLTMPGALNETLLVQSLSLSRQVPMPMSKDAPDSPVCLSCVAKLLFWDLIHSPSVWLPLWHQQMGNHALVNAALEQGILEPLPEAKLLKTMIDAWQKIQPQPQALDHTNGWLWHLYHIGVSEISMIMVLVCLNVIVMIATGLSVQVRQTTKHTTQLAQKALDERLEKTATHLRALEEAKHLENILHVPASDAVNQEAQQGTPNATNTDLHACGQPVPSSKKVRRL